jgi:hypothetical protein
MFEDAKFGQISHIFVRRGTMEARQGQWVLKRNSTCVPVERFAFNPSQENMPTSRCAAFGSFPHPCLRWGLRPQTPDFMR